MKSLALFIFSTVLMITMQTNAKAGAGYALEFDGEDDFVNCDSTLQNEVLEYVTVEAWISSREQSGEGNIFYDGNDGEFHLILREPARPCFAVKLAYSGWCELEMSESLDTLWHYVAGVYDSDRDKIYLYVDESFVDSLDVPDSPLHNPTWWHYPTIGAQSWDWGSVVGPFNGKIDEVRVWNVVRSKDEIYESMHGTLIGDEYGLVGYWRLDEGTGQVAYDLSPCEHHGRLGNSPDEDEADPVWITSGALIGPLSIFLEPDAVIFYRGDHLGFTVTAINHQDSTLSFQAWTEVETAWGWLITPALGPFDVTLPPHRTIRRHIRHFIPWYTPLGGPYNYYGMAGIYQDEVVDQDSFEFYVYP